jgi:hypothetical protein
MQLRLPDTRPSFVDGHERLGQHTEPRCALPDGPICLRQQRQLIRLRPPGSGLVRPEPLADVGDPLCPVSLPDERPAPQHPSLRQPVRKPVRLREGHQGLRLRAHGALLAAELREPGRIAERLR